MKKALFATTALVLSAGVAAADVTISGYGRTGIIYYENDVDGLNETTVVSRLRMNIDASTTTDSGIDFGARFRLQWDQGDDTTGANPGKLYVTAQGLTVEVGNVDTAIDNSGLIYATELGSYDRSVGFSGVVGNFFAYAPKSYGAYNDRVGVAAIYSIDDLTLRASYIDPDQRWDLPGNPEKELGLAVDYVWNDVLELSAAATWNGAGIDDNDIFFVGARYAVTEQARIGLNYIDTNDYDDASYGSVGSTIALYGDYTLLDGLTNIEAYVAHNSDGGDAGVEFETDTAYGIGVNYDLGGARLGASIQRDYWKNVTADMGVRFNF